MRISQKTINLEEIYSIKYQLEKVLLDIPLTFNQRQELDRLVGDFVYLCERLNKNTPNDTN